MTTTDPPRNWAGNLRFGAAAIHRPESEAELGRIVAGARRVRALGSGHSFSPVADTTGDLVRLDGLPATVVVDADAGTATVAAGMRYAEVAEALQHAGWALPNLASLPHISVAGSVATGTHGSGDGLRSLSASVRSLRIVGPSGEARTVTRDADPAFPGTVVALGALGVVTALTLDVEPSFEVEQRVRLDVPLAEIAADFDEVFGAAYSVSAFTGWADGNAAVWLKHRTGRPAGGWAGGRAAPGPVHPVPGQPPEASTGQLGVPGPWHRRLPHFRPEFTPSAGDELQSEWLLPRERAAEAIAALRELGPLVAPVLHISEIRTVRGDDLWLSPAYGSDRVALHFTWHKDPGAVRPVLAAVESALTPLGGRPHWGKITGTPPAALAERYERFPAFARLVRESDPEGKFGNAFLDALLGRP
ncbi:FAD-binding protein [Actinocorallia longicatena]|uniref:Alditol oxidase n=1 Tax=Actinocorallia longicatena TaxID=111803 RepID=A0ABP6PVK1_9ACTN